MSVRVRYAPSPTGLQHIGGVRTALFNYLFAKSQGGKFIVRVEDTDQTRFDPGAMDDLFETLDWLGIDWDEGPVPRGEGYDQKGDHGPYIQSQRSLLYSEAVERLVDQGKAYPCFCSSERLEQVREGQKKAKAKVIGYDRHCRNLSREEVQKRIDAGEAHVFRFAVPLEGETPFEDVLLGTVSRKNRDINPDPVILKQDGLPTYHLANVVDDHAMEITHVLRAQEWIPSGNLHVLLYQALGWKPPVFCHLPMVLGKDGQKLSKRHGSTAAKQFRDAGYLPEAIINYVALLGWSLDGETEIIDRATLESSFSLERINKAGAIFDYKKLDWFNGQYLRSFNIDELDQRVRPFAEAAGWLESGEGAALYKVALPLAQERLKFPADIVDVLGFLFAAPEVKEPEFYVPKKSSAQDSKRALEAFLDLISQLDGGDDEPNEELAHGLAEKLEMKMGAVLMPVRLAVTGTPASPPLMASCRLVGWDEVKQRIQKVIGVLA